LIYGLKKPERMETVMLRNARQRANKHNVLFDLRIEDIEIPSHCCLTGIELIRNSEQGTANIGGTYNSPSLDRVHPELGYIRGNVRVISNLANQMMNTLIDADLLKEAALCFAQNIHQYLNKEELYANIDSRYRGRQPDAECQKHLVPGDPGYEYDEGEQLRLDLPE